MRRSKVNTCAWRKRFRFSTIFCVPLRLSGSSVAITPLHNRLPKALSIGMRHTLILRAIYLGALAPDLPSYTANQRVLMATNAVVATTIRLQFDRAILPFDDLRYDRAAAPRPK